MMDPTLRGELLRFHEAHLRRAAEHHRASRRARAPGAPTSTRNAEMETAPFLDAVETDLESITAGDDDAAIAAGRLAGVLRSSLQLRLFDAMGQAAMELSEQMASGHVEVRLAGRDVELVYVPEEPAAPAPTPDDEESGTARLTLRMPESLKAQVERGRRS